MNPLKKYLLNLFIKFIQHDLVQKQLDFEFNARNKVNNIKENKPTPYNEIKKYSKDPTKGSGVVFITSRFRSGSTLLWNVFRQLETCTAYYEPFNERKWFDSNFRGEHVDDTHIGVNDYWKEYEGMSHLSNFYAENWISDELLMDNKSWNPNMLAYLDYIIDHTYGTPVLQFNRIDFRLPWLRHHYPLSNIIHLYRNPRDQWLSFLKDKIKMNKNDVEKTYIDNFYLNLWCDDLSKFFPFLSKSETPHPYRRFYFLWKLSYLYGIKYADMSICFEDLMINPQVNLNKLFKSVKLDKDVSWPKVLNVIRKPQIGKWKSYAEDNWFSSHEIICESVLSNYLEEL
jgi:hypothetical protein